MLALLDPIGAGPEVRQFYEAALSNVATSAASAAGDDADDASVSDASEEEG